MSLILWTVIAVLVVLVGLLQFVGVRALESWGVRPSRAVIALRAFNLLVVVVLLVVVFIEFMRR